MKAILLCAGYATRLYPLTQDHPKPLLPVGGKPILEWILEALKVSKEPFEAVYIVTNSTFFPHFEKWARDYPKSPWPVEIVNDGTTSNENRLGAIGDLAFTLKQKKIGAEDLFVAAGDNLFDFPLREFFQTARSKHPHPAIAVYDVGDPELARHYGIVRLDRDARVCEFLEKPENPPTTLASCGLYWMPAASRLLLDSYIASGHNSDQPGHYMRWLAETSALYGVPLKGRWLDIGDHASYRKANALVSGSENS